MKNKTSLAKKLLAILLSLIMAVGVATPAFAMEAVKKIPDVQELKDTIELEKEFLKNHKDIHDYGRAIEFLQKEGTPPEGLALVRSYFSGIMSAVRGISSVICFVSSAVSLLKVLGVIKSEADPRFTSIDDSVKEIQAKVDDIDRKADAIQDTLTNEFAYIDLVLLQQDYNHYKNDVWAEFYTEAVQQMNNLRNEYADGVNWLAISFAELWQDRESETGLRALFGKNEETGEIMQVFSGRNMEDPGEKLPAAPQISIDDIPVEYSVTLPAEYICANMSRAVALNNGNYLDEMTKALEKGVYAAAEDGKLAAYSGFDSQWRSFSEEQKQETAKDLAAELLDSLVFACSYAEANEKGFAASVKNAFRIFTTWASGGESLTSPLYARFKMLALTHGFEGEVRDEIDDIYMYMDLLNMTYVEFAETIASMSRSMNENDRIEIRDMYFDAELAMGNEYLNFVTDQPNYCYQTESVLEYKNAVVESNIQFVYGIMPGSKEEHTGEEICRYFGQFNSEKWSVYETSASYSDDKNIAKQQKADSGEDLLKRSISSKETAILYAMYGSSGSKGSFAEYLAANNVTPNAEQVQEGIMNSMVSRNYATTDENKMICYLPANVGNYYFTKGKTYSVKYDLRDKLSGHHSDSNYQIYDQATGGYFNTKTGAGNENATLAGRTFYADHDMWPADIMVAFSTCKNKTERQYMDIKQQEKEYGKPLDDANIYDVYKATSTFYDNYGMLVSAQMNTYTFPEDTKKIPDNYFRNGADLDELNIYGTPEEIGENAFAGVGTPVDRCLLRVGFAPGSLVNAWHGGYFGNTYITVQKNDGSGENETVVAVAGEAISNVVCPFTAPEHATFAGWSFYPKGSIVNPNETVPYVHGTINETTLYALWKYDHEHDFEVTKEGTDPTCTEDGCTEEKTCKTCGYVEYEVLPATGHTCTYTKSEDNYIAKCSTCGYETTLYPNECGYQTVWGEAQDGSGIVYISALGMQGTHIGNDGIYVIKSTQYSTQSLLVYDGLNVSICFDGVDFAGNYGKVGFDAGKSNVNLTLKGENSITTLDADTFVSAGNLTIDGDGSLLLTSNYDDSAFYTPGVPFNTTGAHTVIKGGNICAMGGDLFSVMINDDVTHGDLVIEKNVCFYAENGIDTIPVNGAGEKVYPVLIDNPEELVIAVDSRRFPFRVLPGRTDACIYLTSGKHDVRFINGENLYVDPEIGGSVLEKQYGDFTVLNPDDDEKAVEYSGGVLTVKKSTPITIKNTDPSKPTTDRIVIAKNISADITFDGVSIQTGAISGKYAITPVTIEEDSTANVIITLAEGSENILTAGNNMPAISKNGTKGTLTIKGSGSLSATGGQNAAAIGSSMSNPTAGIIISGGNIVAQTSGEGAAAIGAGKNEYIGISAVAKDITINGGTVTAICGNNTYAIGGAKAENITINGGVVTAESSVNNDSYGGIGGCPVVVENTASVKAPFVENPINSKGKNVSLNVLSVTPGELVVIDGNAYRCIGHNGEDKMYLYLTDSNAVRRIHGITVEESERGTVNYSPTIPQPGDTVTLSAEANDGYAFVDYEITPAVEITDGTFVMPEEEVTVKGVFAKVSTVTVTESEHGKVLPSKSIVNAGEKVSIYVMPDEGYELDTLTLTPETALEDDSFIMPEEDVTISCTFKAETKKITWNIDGETTETGFTFGSEITKPEDPEKEGYNFMGWTPAIPDKMPDEDIEFFAVFEPITYTATFKADGKKIADVDYTIDTVKLDEPAVPQKDGYTGKWNEYTLKVGGITVNAAYTPIVYKAKFVADGKLVKDVEYDVTTLEITEPAVPEKSGFTGRWSNYELRPGGITVQAIYTVDDKIIHQHTFDTTYSYNEAAHWFASTCGHDIVSSLAAHTFGSGIIFGDVTKYVCTKCGYVETVYNSVDKVNNDLLLSITAAKDAVDKAAAGGTEETLQYAAAAKTELEKQTDISAVNEKLVEALKAINGMQTEKAVADALQYLDTVAGSSASNKAKAAAKQAKAAVKQAQTPEEVNTILADALGEIEKAEQELGDLCPNCGKTHEDNLWGRIFCFFIRAFEWIKNFIVKVF